jgi:hypothetical protein
MNNSTEWGMENLVQRGIAMLVVGLLLLWMMAAIVAMLFTMPS